MNDSMARSLVCAISLWEEAVEKLPPADRPFLSNQKCADDRIQILQNILSIAETKRDICNKKQWKYKKRNGDVVVIRDQLDKVAAWVQRFKDVGSTIVQYDPVHAAIPWAGVLLILRCIAGDAQTMGAMVDGIERVASLLPRYAVLEQVCHQRSTPLSGGVEQLKIALVKAYTSILRYLVAARRYFEKNTMKRTLKAVVGTLEAETQRYLDVISKKETDIDSCLLLLQSEFSHIASGQTADILQSLADLKAPIFRNSTQIAQLCKQLSVQERRRVMTWLSTTRSSLHHRSEGEDYLPGTGTWLLQNREYLRWRDSSSCAILWLHGIPGCGKTKLIYKVVQTLLQETLSMPNPAPMAYFYCARNPAEPERSNPTAVLRSLLKQLAVTRRGDLKDRVLQEFQRQDEEAQLEGCGDPAPLNLADATTMIMSLLQEDPAIIIIDALDECDPGERHKLLEALEQILSESANLVKILVSSRDEGDLSCHLRNVPNVYIRADDNSRDIRYFIDYSVSKAISSGRLLHGNLSEAARDQVSETLKTRSHGMFRWAAMQIDNLCDQRRVKIESDLLDELGSLPPTLRESYSRSCQRVWGFARPSRMIADRVFKWLLCAQKLMSIEDLAAAVTLESESYVLSLESILDICSNLVVVDDRGHFRFAHLSVREYFEELEDFSAAQCHSVVLQRCLEVYLNMTSVDWDSQQYGGNDVQLQQYAMLFWPHHCQGIGAPTLNGKLEKTTDVFLFAAKSPDAQPGNALADHGDGRLFSQALADWLADIRNATQYTGLGEFDGTLIERFESATSPRYTPEFLACTFDFVWILKSMESRGWRDWDQLNHNEQSCVSVAVRWDAVHALQWLLDGSRATAEALTDALSVAINLAKFEIAASLIQHGANGFPCLDAAISMRNCSVIGLILDQTHNFDPYVFGNGIIRAYQESRTRLFPLFWDAFMRVSPPDAVRVFLMVNANRHKLDLDSTDTGLYDRTRGHLRTSTSDEATAIFGLSNRLGHYFDNLTVLKNGSLAFAGIRIWDVVATRDTSIWGSDTMGLGNRQIVFSNDDIVANNSAEIFRILLLLERGEAMLRRVLYKVFGADNAETPPNCNLQDLTLVLLCIRAKDDETHFGSLTDLVKVLLDYGADVNIGDLDPKGRTPLMFTAKSHDGALPLLEALIDAGADLDRTDNKGKTALMHALKSGNDAAAVLLIRKGCNVNCAAADGWTTLMLAAIRCQHDMIKLLRSYGARRPRPAMDDYVAIPFMIGGTGMCRECITALLGPGSGDQDRPSGVQRIFDIISGSFYPDTGHDGDGNLTETNDETGAARMASEVTFSKVERLRQIELLPNANSWEDGMTPLQVAICLREMEVVDYFLSIPVDVNATDNHGFSALHYAVAHSLGGPIIDLLISRGADPAVQDNNGCTPLHLVPAAGWRGEDHAKTLLRAMPLSGVNIANSSGETALHVAIMSKRKEIIPLLLMAGADPSAQNSHDQTCIQLALAMDIGVSEFFTDYYLDVFSDARCFLFQQDASGDGIFDDRHGEIRGLLARVVDHVDEGGPDDDNTLEIVLQQEAKEVVLDSRRQWQDKWLNWIEDNAEPVKDVDLFDAHGEGGWSAIGGSLILPLRPLDAIYREQGC